MQYFLGRYDYAMDDRGRVPMPPPYRDRFTLGAVVSHVSPDRCLRVYTVDGFETQAALYASEPPTRRAGRIVRHGFFGRSYAVEMDKQGRILIPPALRPSAALESSVVVVGSGEWLEVWSPERFEEEMAEVDEKLGPTLEDLEPKE